MVFGVELSQLSLIADSKWLPVQVYVEIYFIFTKNCLNVDIYVYAVCLMLISGPKVP